MKTTLKSISGEIYIDAEFEENASGEQELSKITDISFLLRKEGCSLNMNITDFTDKFGQTIGDIICEKIWSTFETLIMIQDEKEKESSWDGRCYVEYRR